MKPLFLIAAFVVACVPLGSVAQAPAQPQHAPKPAKVSFSGRVREDGHAVLVQGRAWIVSNGEKLREHVGESVSVKGLLDPLTNEVRVVSLKAIRLPENTTAHLGDSAFRR